MRFLGWLVLLTPDSLLAQFRVLLSGYVRDTRTGEALIGATVYAPAQQAGT